MLAPAPSPADRAEAIRRLPATTGWREAFARRENGEPIEAIARHVRCSREQLEEGLAVCYQWVTTESINICTQRSGGPAYRQAVPSDVEAYVHALEDSMS